MALVEYSDNSDISDIEDNSPPIIIKHSENKSPISIANNNNEITLAGIESIEDEDDFIAANSTNYDESFDEESSSILSLLASIPLADKLEQKKPNINIEVNDVVDDVPTVKSWNINEKTKVEFLVEKCASTSQKRPGKRKFILSALSEFINEDDEKEESETKKIKQSAAGCGLLSMLPPIKRPQTKINSFMPDSVKKFLKPKQVPKLKPTKPTVEDNSDNEEDLNNCDFFSFEDNKVLPEEIHPSICPIPGVTTLEIMPLTESVKIGPVQDINIEATNRVNDSKVLQHDMSLPIQGPSKSPSMVQNDLIKLAGRRNRNEIVNIIDVDANDALMSRQEWMTRALIEEKPSRSYSKKRGDGPSQQSKRKHQITYLAQQAKDRELELQNNWATGRLTKKQTQAKYGF